MTTLFRQGMLVALVSLWAVLGTARSADAQLCFAGPNCPRR
jgi:hypothetical protein